MPKIVDEAAQRERIRRAARAVFAERGLVGTGLAHVARAAGMRRSNLYHYYVDKDALVRDLAEDLLAEEEALFVQAMTGEGTPLERIVQLAEAVTELFEYWGAAGRLILQLWANQPRPVRELLRRIRRQLADVIREGQQTGEIANALVPETTAAMIVGLIDGVLVQVFLDAEPFADAATVRRAVGTSVRNILTY